MTNETALTISEQSQLSELEDIIDRGLQTFYEVGKALTIIRDEKLYRAGYATFEDYCEEKWQMSRAYAYRTIGAADVVKSLSPIGDIPLPTNEAQARPLTSLEPEQRQQAWTKAVEESGGKPTARQVQQAADAVSGTVYESIHSLQSAVLAYHRRVCISNKDMIASLESLKADRKSSGWGALSLDLGRNGKIFRGNDLRQAVNNALDSLRFTAGQTTISQPSEPAQETPSLIDSVEGFILAYQDPQGRHWSQISNPSHTNGAFWQTIKNTFDRDGVAYKDEEKLKFTIKWAFSRLLREAEMAADEPATAATEPEKPAKHWGLSNGMAFWTMVDKLGVARAGIFEFLQPGARYLTDLNMTREEAFSRLADAPRWADPYNPTQMVEPVAPVPPFKPGDTVAITVGGWKGRTGKILDVDFRSAWVECMGEVRYPDKPSEVKLVSAQFEFGWLERIDAPDEPAAAPVLNEEQTKPRIASFVMGYFQAANEAIARIATAIPKARTDDIHDMLTIVASLERMEQRIGAEYDMS